jgi:hypothetical protein
MMFKNLYIAYSNPADSLDTFTLKYKLRDNSVVPKWCEQVELAQKQYKIDDPGRFYGFGSTQKQTKDAIELTNNCIRTINDFELIIDHDLEDINDQDTLNYLHHIFEVYHGLLDNQTHEFWQRAPENVRLALADLNVLVHRCESVQRGANPRHVVTYYGLPKTKTLDIDDYKYFTDDYQFGTVYLNYVEIGKTLEDLAQDDDQYIADDAFRPFQHYSADFNVKFWNEDRRQLYQKHVKIKYYYDANRKFFDQRELYWGHPYLQNGSIPLADLQYTGNRKELLKELESHQWVREVILL